MILYVINYSIPRHDDYQPSKCSNDYIQLYTNQLSYHTTTWNHIYDLSNARPSDESSRTDSHVQSAIDPVLIAHPKLPIFVEDILNHQFRKVNHTNKQILYIK